MHLIGSTAVLLALGISAVVGHVIYSTHEHGNHHQQAAVSYSMVDMHDQHHIGPYHHGSEMHDIHSDHDAHDQLNQHNDFMAYEQHKDHDDEHMEHHHDEKKHDEHAKYDFKYGVNDPKSGDVHEQWESRDGDKVTGGYSLKETDGTTRVVHYKADKKKGFEAMVHTIGEAKMEHKEHQHQEYLADVGHDLQHHSWDN